MPKPWFSTVPSWVNICPTHGVQIYLPEVSSRLSSHLSYSSKPPPCAPRNFYKQPISIPRPGKNANSYRAWPSYRQAIVDRKRNTAQRLDNVRREYEDKRNEDVKQHADLLDQLSRMVANHNMQIDSLTPPLALLSSTLHQQEANLETRSKILDNRNTNISSYTPSSAFALHRRIAPAISQLASSLRETDESFLTIVPDDRAVLYYTRHVHDIQYDLRDNEWAKFKKNPAAPYELADLPSNPATEDSNTQKAPTSTKLAFHISHLVLLRLVSHTSYLAPRTFAPRTFAPRISHLVSRASYLMPRTPTPHILRLVPSCLVSREFGVFYPNIESNTDHFYYAYLSQTRTEDFSSDGRLFIGIGLVLVIFGKMDDACPNPYFTHTIPAVI
ncbi:hypothetical protein BS47DRAFT_1393710 [Hydnum rufescens UP504]|uniref:Uncharacterized protein n=1 Tax=Hydnum rufescens UP504 TaxID=1448309 RepID=A0A9P6AW86_9AGAM|nr:hypothetical protein BS47DRAFT_1393710 [Hydnum rufescens UP504]